MEPCVRYWRSQEGQTFLQRFLHWVDVLDPSVLLASKGEIENSRLVLDSLGEPGRDFTQDKKVKEAWKLNLSSVHPDTGKIIPLVFRPPALLPVATPVVVATLLPHQKTVHALIWQFFFHIYSAGFNLANGNSMSQEKNVPLKQAVFCIGAISYGAFVGSFPQFLANRYNLKTSALQTFVKKLLPVPLFTFLSVFNLAVVRAVEAENGIQVVDKHGNVVGVSKKAGDKAIKETAISRAALIGTSGLVPGLLTHVLQRMQFIQRNAFIVAPVRHITVAVTFGVMIPVSFSLFPRIGTILRTDLEEEIQSCTEETELFYNRGL
ncbi:sideroflexin-4 [Microcaecilia unicolor]|uniref:Sideroflexin-4 n=1 Tax=Microcaecilia unicolor TaxID=1415580 RepID=A0A6P7Y6W7_9AMPH|nr:sideroflexin-4 [Microcaecilia unicolor]